VNRGQEIDYSITPLAPGNLTVDVVNINGQVVQTLFFGGVDAPVRRTFTLDNQPAGMYFVRSNFDGSIKSHKFVR
jgi:hypothetical protein